jgi:hypothetical protein
MNFWRGVMAWVMASRVVRPWSRGCSGVQEAVLAGQRPEAFGWALGLARSDASEGVIHLAYGHGDRQAAAADRLAIDALGDGLRGSGRPLLVTSGTLVRPAGRVGAEAGAPDPAAPGAPRMAGEHAARSLVGRGVRSSTVRLAPCMRDRVERGFAGALIDIAQKSGISGYIGDGSQRSGVGTSAGRCGGDQPVRSQPGRQELDQRGEDRSVGPVQPGPRIGLAQHGNLMPQHQQLGVLAADDRLSRTIQPQTRTKTR